MQAHRRNGSGPRMIVILPAIAAAFTGSAPAQVGAGSIEPYSISQSDTLRSSEAMDYSRFPPEKLKEVIPELKGFQYDANQDRLAAILTRVAQRIADVLPRFPNLVSREEI